MTAYSGVFRAENTPEAIAALLTAQSVTDAGIIHITPCGNNLSKVTITIIKK